MTPTLFRSIDRTSYEICSHKSIDLTKSITNLLPFPASIKGSGNSLVGAFFGRNTSVLTPFAQTLLVQPKTTSQSITVYASTTLVDLYNHLIKYGFTLKALPSYPAVTIGGCIAANVHGQNQYLEGCFEENILSLTIFHPSFGELTVSRQENPRLFFLTIGGYGLTGIILRAELQIIKIPTNVLNVTTRPFLTLEEAYLILLEERDSFDFFHCSSNMLQLKKSRQPGFVLLGKFDESPGLVNDRLPFVSRFFQEHAAFPRTPLTASLISLTQLLDRTRNSLNFSGKSRLSDFLFPSHRRMAYFSLFGGRGMIEHQVLIPHESVTNYLSCLKTILLSFSPVVPLFHMKLFGGKRRLLNFNGTGLCLALHLQYDEATIRTLRSIDGLDNSLGCITNIIKDSRIPRAAVTQQYSELEDFRNQIYDLSPNLYFQNLISQRLL